LQKIGLLDQVIAKRKRVHFLPHTVVRLLIGHVSLNRRLTIMKIRIRLILSVGHVVKKRKLPVIFFV